MVLQDLAGVWDRVSHNDVTELEEMVGKSSGLTQASVGASERRQGRCSRGGDMISVLGAGCDFRSSLTHSALMWGGLDQG